MENKKEDFQRGIYKLATLLLVAFISQSAFAQKQTITGRIIDINNEAIIGASILEKGTTNGTITDFDGKFSLEVSSKSTLIISYIGFFINLIVCWQSPLQNLLLRCGPYF